MKFFAYLLLLWLAFNSSQAQNTFYIQYCNNTRHPVSYKNTYDSLFWSDPGSFNDIGSLEAGKCSDGKSTRLNPHTITAPFWNTSDNEDALGPGSDEVFSVFDNYPLVLCNPKVGKPWFAGLGQPIFLTAPYTFYLTAFSDPAGYDRIYYSFTEPAQNRNLVPPSVPDSSYTMLDYRAPTVANLVKLHFDFINPGQDQRLFYSLYDQDSKSYLQLNQPLILVDNSFELTLPYYNMAFIVSCSGISFSCPDTPDINISHNYTLLISGLLIQNKFPTTLSLNLSSDFSFSNPDGKIPSSMGINLSYPAFLSSGISIGEPISWSQVSEKFVEDFKIQTVISVTLALNNSDFISTLNPVQKSGFNAMLSCSYRKNYLTDACYFTPVTALKNESQLK